MNRFACLTMLLTLTWPAARAQSTWGLGKPVPGGCPATSYLPIPPDGTRRFGVNFCVPHSYSGAYDFVSRSERDLTNSHGKPEHKVEFTENGDHWEMVVGYADFKDGSRVSYRQSRGDVSSAFNDFSGWELLESHEILHSECNDVGVQQGVALIKNDGRHVYFKIWFGGDVKFAVVVTDCAKGACDADELAYGLLSHVTFPELAACPH